MPARCSGVYPSYGARLRVNTQPLHRTPSPPACAPLCSHRHRHETSPRHGLEIQFEEEWGVITALSAFRSTHTSHNRQRALFLQVIDSGLLAPRRQQKAEDALASHLPGIWSYRGSRGTKKGQFLDGDTLLEKRGRRPLNQPAALCKNRHDRALREAGLGVSWKFECVLPWKDYFLLPVNARFSRRSTRPESLH